ncbi:putative enzyme related to lactoylglutathione lyase [Tamaricihabitans halophyticus]|uniref:Putative enzyme related to lactoylglutathione lyase n=2 Tax=Tamaricihabitans halophyticus TaxID=1262583 RepID=A0A4R2QFH9_9PSEU|nr:putative enzyme related to lactoylglutathione lyase [Tamaricihabitans halophyticus]
MDIKTRDVTGTAAFCTAVFGWDFATEPDAIRRATTISVRGHPIGSVSDLATGPYPPETPAHIAYYLAVTDVDRRAAIAEREGAEVVLPPVDIGAEGRLATLVDPLGAAFSLWQAGTFTGWSLPAPAGGVPHRLVLNCTDPDLAERFYRNTLGVLPPEATFRGATARTVKEPRWELAVLLDEPGGLAGVMAKHDAMPPHRSATLENSLRLHSREGLASYVLPTDSTTPQR